MDFLAVNWLAIVLATVASMALGAAWYGVLSAQWLAASGRTKEDIDPKDFMPYVWSVIVQLVMAYFLAVLTPPLAGAPPESAPPVSQEPFQISGFTSTVVLFATAYCGGMVQMTCNSGSTCPATSTKVRGSACP